jgi:hypothetical protein
MTALVVPRDFPRPVNFKDSPVTLKAQIDAWAKTGIENWEVLNHAKTRHVYFGYDEIPGTLTPFETPVISAFRKQGLMTEYLRVKPKNILMECDVRLPVGGVMLRIANYDGIKFALERLVEIAADCIRVYTKDDDLLSSLSGIQYWVEKVNDLLVEPLRVLYATDADNQLPRRQTIDVVQSMQRTLGLLDGTPSLVGKLPKMRLMIGNACDWKGLSRSAWRVDDVQRARENTAGVPP